MRYLEERKDYVIKYLSEPLPTFNLNAPHYIHAELLDKKTNTIYCDREDYFGDLEPCLMKLGRRLIRKWEKTKK